MLRLTQQTSHVTFCLQAYSWALNGMKFVVMLSVDECVNIEKCQEMINKFDNYMKQHPPITEVCCLIQKQIFLNL